MRIASRAALLAVVCLVWAGRAPAQSAGTWTQLRGTWNGKTGSPFAQTGTFPDTPLLLMDGRVLVHQYMSNNWYALTPDQHGSYATGTWTAVPIPANWGYAPQNFASAILPSGNLLVEGGEYNADDANGTWDFTNDGAIFVAGSNQWRPVCAPSGWAHIGDASNVVLPDGTFLMNQENGYLPTKALATFTEATALANAPASYAACATQQAAQNPWFSWKANQSTSIQDFTLLPDGSILSLFSNGNYPSIVQSLPASGWINGQNTWQTGGNVNPGFNLTSLAYNIGWYQFGPNLLRNDGTMVSFGSTSVYGIYSPPGAANATAVWNGPYSYPVSTRYRNNLTVQMGDGPAVLLADNNILIFAAPGLVDNDASLTACNNPGITLSNTTQGQQACGEFWELQAPNPATPIPVPYPNTATLAPPDSARMLPLPNGQVLWSSGGYLVEPTGDLELYTPAYGQNNAYAPGVGFIENSALVLTRTLTRGSPYTVLGVYMNGFSEASHHGHDAYNATNYPLLLITDSLNHSTYAEISGTSMGVGNYATGPSNNLTGAGFTVPGSVAPGAANLYIVANGIKSSAYGITVK